nr:retrovirus-related Pol polyprotein from transposon TNT 1-94 [Tanacetum cinerariifolium]
MATNGTMMEVRKQQAASTTPKAVSSAITMGSKAVRWSESGKIASVRSNSYLKTSSAPTTNFPFLNNWLVHNNRYSQSLFPVNEIDIDECLPAFIQSQYAALTVGHWLSLLLKAADVEAARGHIGSSKIRVEAFITLRVLVAKIGKVLHVSKTMISGAAGNMEAMDQALRALTEFLMIVLAPKNVEVVVDKDDATLENVEEPPKMNILVSTLRPLSMQYNYRIRVAWLILFRLTNYVSEIIVDAKRVKMRCLLIQHGWVAALDPFPGIMTDADKTAALKTDVYKKAHSALLLCLDNKVLREVNKKDSSAGVWLKLGTLYMTKSLVNKLYLKKKLFTFYMHSGKKLPEHINEFNKMIGDLANIDVDIDDEDKALMLLTSLPPSYDNFMETLLYERDSLTLKDVLSSLNSRELIKRIDAKDDGDRLNIWGRSDHRGNQGRGSSRSKSKGKRTYKLKCYIYNSEDRLKKDCQKRNKKKSTGFVKKNAGQGSGMHSEGYEKGNLLMAMSEERFLEACAIMGIRKMRVQMKDGSSFVLENVRYIPELKRNLIFLGTLDREGYTVKLQNGRVKVVKGFLMVLSRTMKENYVYSLDDWAESGEANVGIQEKESLAQVWYECMGHISEEGLHELEKKMCLGIKKLVSCKWLYKIKEGIEGVQKTRYKAGLVARGFIQRAGIDYNEELGPARKIVGMEIVRDRGSRILKVSQPDIAYALSIVSRYLVNPGKNQWEAVKWILKYLKCTANVGLVYGRDQGKHVDIDGFVNTDYAKDLDNGRSITGEIVESKEMEMEKIGTKDNAADAFTKVVPGPKFKYCEILDVGAN